MNFFYCLLFAQIAKITWADNIAENQSKLKNDDECWAVTLVLSQLSKILLEIFVSFSAQLWSHCLMISLLTMNFTSPALTNRVISTTYSIFDVLFSGLIKHIQNLCAIGTKKIFKVETISFFNFKPTGRRNICQMVAFFSIAHYSKKDSIYIM